ncbi:cupin domain-containing protein [Labedella phragmitis]|uniref:cupin domain-containing protein n=1 Tax=Labedella phragmitis TaxID=2498849 RepID=UPI001FB7277E|nr:cupin domain-containing protein [Labedella phragmitis]
MPHLDLDPDSVLSLHTVALDAIDAGAGAPPTWLRELGSFGSVEIGVWEMEPGVATDTEADELFVVLAGAGRIDLLDADRSLEIAPGDLVRLAAGTRTRWTVTATLRKLYLAP